MKNQRNIKMKSKMNDESFNNKTDSIDFSSYDNLQTLWIKVNHIVFHLPKLYRTVFQSKERGAFTENDMNTLDKEIQ